MKQKYIRSDFVIEFINVTKKFDEKIALEEINITINDGEIIGVVGANGAGKSTFMRILSGVLLPSSGSVLIDGENIDESISTKQGLFFFPDEQYFYTGATIKEVASFYSIFYDNFDYSVFIRLCDSFEFDINTKISKLSKGMKKQVMVIIGISIRPKYMLLDEVFDGVDSITKQTLKSALTRLAIEYKTTIITTSHNIREIEDICEKILLIYKSKLILFTDINELKSRNTDLSLEDILVKELEDKGYASKNIDFI